MTFEQILFVTLIAIGIIAIGFCVHLYMEALKIFKDEYGLLIKLINNIAQSYKSTFGENSISEVSVLLDDLKKYFEDKAKNG